jgi:hypothetical protein
VKYYPTARNYTRTIKPHLADPAAQKALVRDFHRYTPGPVGKNLSCRE